MSKELEEAIKKEMESLYSICGIPKEKLESDEGEVSGIARAIREREEQECLKRKKNQLKN